VLRVAPRLRSVQLQHRVPTGPPRPPTVADLEGLVMDGTTGALILVVTAGLTILAFLYLIDGNGRR
jgi:hypothetical protein